MERDREREREYVTTVASLREGLCRWHLRERKNTILKKRMNVLYKVVFLLS